MKYAIITTCLASCFLLYFSGASRSNEQASSPPQGEAGTAQMGEQAAPGSNELTLITDTPEEGFDLAVELSRKGVTRTQPDTDVLHTLREHYARDADALIAASHVIAVHYQTIAEANNYWRE